MGRIKRTIKGKKIKKMCMTGAAALSLVAPAVLLSGCTVSTKLDIRINGDYVQWTKDGEAWTNLIALKDLQGDVSSFTIGEDGYWYVDGIRTDEKAIGEDGNGIASMVIDETRSDEEKTTYLVTFDNGETFSFEVKNGSNGKDVSVEIGEDGYWYIDGEKTEYKANGEDGNGIDSI